VIGNKKGNKNKRIRWQIGGTVQSSEKVRCTLQVPLKFSTVFQKVAF